MSKNKQQKKGGNPSKAEKNIAALQKTKTVAEAKEAAKAETPSTKEEPKEQPKQQLAATTKEAPKEPRSTPLGKSVYETFRLCEKAPHMERKNFRGFINDKGVETVETAFTNVDTKAVSSQMFPFSALKKEDVKEGDLMYHVLADKFKCLKEAAAQTKEAEKDKAKEAKAKTKAEEAEVIEAEVVDTAAEQKAAPQTPTTPKTASAPVTNLSMANVMGKMIDGERISPSDTIQFMGLLERNYKNKKGAIPAEQEKAVDTVFDLMAMSTIVKWVGQTASDCAEVGIQVNNEMFEAMSETFGKFFNTKLIAAPKTSDTQTTINFKETMENAPESTKAAIKQEAKVKEVQELPEYKEGMTEEEILDAIRSILSMKGNGQSQNMSNSIDFARKAFKMEDAEPAMILANLVKKFGKEKPCMILTGTSNAVTGMLSATNSPFAPHSWLKNKMFPNSSEKELANLTRLFLSIGFENKLKDKQTFENISTPYSKIFAGMNDDLINRIIEASKKGENVEVDVPKGSKVNVDATKVINYLKTAYGADMSDKLIKAKMQELMGLHKKPINKLEYYVEKSAYADGKK